MLKLKSAIFALVFSLAASGAHAEWTDIGQGVFYEGLLSYYSEMGIPTDLSWSVTIQEDSQTKGLYRLAPYSGKNPIADLMSYGDDTYMVIHAEDPQKVWMEDFDCYDDMFCFSHCVPENEWTGVEPKYGTVSDGVITFPAGCIATVDIYDPSQWHAANTDGFFKIALPGSGSQVEDYSLYLDYKYCGAGNQVPVTITVGQSVAALKYVLETGCVAADADTNSNLDEAWMTYVKNSGNAIASGEQTILCDGHGMHSLLVVALDADGNAKAGKVAYIYGDKTDEAQWESLGDVKYNEDLFAGYYEDLPQVELTCELQASKAVKGYYRLVNPYASYEGNVLAGHPGHNHYIYIHAENPQAVWVENSPLGIDFGDGYGEGRVTSNVAMMLEGGATLEEAIAQSGEEVGRVSDGNVIEFPRWGLWVGQSGFFNGNWTSTGQNFRVAIPAGAAGISSVEADDAAPAEYFNLQGMRIQQPASGLYIEKHGTRITKRIK